MTTATAKESVKTCWRDKEEQREPVAITTCGWASEYLASALECEVLRQSRTFQRRVYRIKDLPADIAQAIQTSKMNLTWDHLNALLDEK